jgi:hypothetical protein
MSRSISDRVREMAVEVVEARGLPADNREGYIDYLVDLADVIPLCDVLNPVCRDHYEAFCEVERVEARVEALER